MKLTSKMLKALLRALTLLGCLAIVPALVVIPKAESQPASARTLFGVTWIDGSTHLVEIDPMTGGMTPVGSPLGVLGISGGVSALDATNHQYFFTGTALEGGGIRLFVVNTQTGAVVANPSISPSPPSIEFESVTSTLFGVTWIDGSTHLVEIDPMTGGMTPVGSPLGVLGISGGVSALDATNHRYFFTGTALEGGGICLFVVNTQTGAVVANPSISPNPPSIEFESVTGTLFGVTWIDGSTHLVEIDPMTGGMTPVGSPLGVLGISGGVSALDATNHRYFFTGTALEGGGIRLFVVNTQTGAVVANPSISPSPPSIEFESDIVPPAAVENLATANPTTRSITLTWIAPGDDGNTGTASTYDIRYLTSPITEDNWVSATQCTSEPAPQPAGSSETFTVTGLSPGTTYYFALKAADEVPNWSGLSNVVEGKTQTPPKPVGGVIAPVSKLGLVAPWLGLVAVMMVIVVPVLFKKRRG